MRWLNILHNKTQNGRKAEFSTSSRNIRNLLPVFKNRDFVKDADCLEMEFEMNLFEI